MTSAAPDPSMLVGSCIDCGNPVYRRTRSGAAPKRCSECRPGAFKGGRQRGNSTGEPGPILTIRAAMHSAEPHVQIIAAGECLSIATGVGRPMADSIIATIDVLLAQGETGEDVRRRLNPNPTGFGRVPAGAPYDDDDSDPDSDVVDLFDAWMKGDH